MNKFTLLQQLTTYPDEAVLREGQQAMRAWHSLYCGGFVAEALLTPTAGSRYMSYVCSCLCKQGAVPFAWLSICCQHNDDQVHHLCRCRFAVGMCTQATHMCKVYSTYLEPLVPQQSFCCVTMYRRKGGHMFCFLRCRCYGGCSCPLRISININLDLQSLYFLLLHPAMAHVVKPCSCCSDDFVLSCSSWLGNLMTYHKFIPTRVCDLGKYCFLHSHVTALQKLYAHLGWKHTDLSSQLIQPVFPILLLLLQQQRLFQFQLLLICSLSLPVGDSLLVDQGPFPSLVTIMRYQYDMKPFNLVQVLHSLW